MTQLTMEDVAKRLADLENQVALLAGKAVVRKDWRHSVGMFEGSEFMRAVDADVLAAREAEREAARTRKCD